MPAYYYYVEFKHFETKNFQLKILQLVWIIPPSLPQIWIVHDFPSACHSILAVIHIRVFQ